MIAPSSVDLDYILGNSVDDRAFVEEDSLEPDSLKRRNAIIGGNRPVILGSSSRNSELDDISSTFMTGIELGGSISRKEVAESFYVLPELSSNRSTHAPSDRQLPVGAELLLKNVDPETLLSRSNGRFELPGGLRLSEGETNKYFGPEARTKFFDQLQTLQNKRNICGTQNDHSSSADLAYSIAIARGGKESMLKKMVNNFPFQPDRPTESALKLNTRVIIRTQSLGEGNAYAQMKLIEKPKHLQLDQCKEIDEDQADEEEEDDEVYHTSSKRLSPSLRPPSLHITDVIKKSTSRSTPSNKASKNFVAQQKSKPSPHVVKLKPLVTGKTTRSSHIATLSSLSTSTVLNSARSSDSVQSGPRNLSETKTDEFVELNKVPSTPKHGHLKKLDDKSRSSYAHHEKSSDSKPKHKHASIEINKKEDPAALGESSIQNVAELYQKRIAYEQKVAKAKRKTRDVGELDEDSLIPAMELICVDHRDALNKRIVDKLHKKNSLFQYVEAKTAKRDFYDMSDNSDESDEDVEISLWSEASPLSPAHVAPMMCSPNKAENTNRRCFLRRKKGDKDIVYQPLPLSDNLALSPRSRFIDSCIRQRLNPRASLILRKTFTRELNLRHLGMGDEMAVLLADAIVTVPHIESLNVCDNNLHDKGLSSIIYAICNMKELVQLDMSMNEIGPSAAFALDNYLRRPDCPLVSLTLRKADVDDDECRDFVRALEHNKNLRTLDLSENLVGSSENLNTVMPDLVTGGEALADLLSSPSCPITSLRLGWNMLRLGGAISLCSSLALNQSLTFLELSFNSLGPSGGIALGDALQENKVLKTLLLSNNSLDSIACVTICAGILENEALSEISFDGNPIGEQGAKVLMLLPTIVGGRVSVSAKTCNTTLRDPHNWFDTAALVRKFELNLSQPFERAIAIILLFMVPSHQTYIAAQCEYFDPDSNQWIDLKLKETIDLEHFKKHPLEPEQAIAIANLRKVKEATKDIHKAKDLFEEIDEDGSGQLDQHEFTNLMAEIGVEL